MHWPVNNVKMFFIAVCVSMIDKLQDEHLYEIFMDKFQDVVSSHKTLKLK